MNRSILSFCGAGEVVLADLLLVTVHRADEGQGLGHRLGLRFFGAFEAAARMAPALGMDDFAPARTRVGRVPLIAVGQERAAELAQQAAHVAVLA